MHTDFELVSRTTFRNTSNTNKLQLHCEDQDWTTLFQSLKIHWI